MSQQLPAVPAPPATLTMYSTPWCGYCRRLKGQMEREGIAYTVEVDIEEDPEAADLRHARSTAATRPCRPSSSRTAAR